LEMTSDFYISIHRAASHLILKGASAGGIQTLHIQLKLVKRLSRKHGLDAVIEVKQLLTATYRITLVIDIFPPTPCFSSSRRQNHRKAILYSGVKNPYKNIYEARKLGSTHA
jgi:hypothetical protein